MMGLKDLNVEYEPINIKEDTLMTPFSSGTTGPPKGIITTHYNMIAAASQNVNCADEFRLIPDSIAKLADFNTVCFLPLYHAFGMTAVIMPTLFVGGKVVVVPSDDVDLFLKVVGRYEPAFIDGYPALINALMDAPLVENGKLDKLQYVLSGGFPSDENLRMKVREKLPNCVFRQ